MLELGSLLDGKYKILNEIGRGGMSVVYLALNERANKTWAVKEVRKDGGNDAEVVSQGLAAETEMLKKLDPAGPSSRTRSSSGPGSCAMYWTTCTAGVPR